jgi:enediyne core biosynthesis thioesterase
MRCYEYRHIVGFEDTNVAGNVYYLNHLRWQGRCREMFLREHAPGVVGRLASDLALVTVRCSCEYFGELTAFDEIVVRMHLESMVQNRIHMIFEYWLQKGGLDSLIARGAQQVACMRRDGAQLAPVAIPDELRMAIEEYAAT